MGGLLEGKSSGYRRMGGRARQQGSYNKDCAEAISLSSARPERNSRAAPAQKARQPHYHPERSGIRPDGNNIWKEGRTRRDVVG